MPSGEVECHLSTTSGSNQDPTAHVREDREAKPERNPKCRLVISAGEKDRRSNEVWKIRRALSFYEWFSFGTFSLMNSFAEKALFNLTLHSSFSRLHTLQIKICVALNDFHCLLNSLEIHLGFSSSPNSYASSDTQHRISSEECSGECICQSNVLLTGEK